MERRSWWSESVGTRIPKRVKHPEQRIYFDKRGNRLSIEFQEIKGDQEKKKIVKVKTPNSIVTVRIFPSDHDGQVELKQFLSSHNLSKFRFAGHRIRAVRIK